MYESIIRVASKKRQNGLEHNLIVHIFPSAIQTKFFFQHMLSEKT